MSFNDRLIAHRGWQRRFPENTLVGIEAAISAGAKHIEIDIQLTADHVAILCHDQSLLRVCGNEQTIDKLLYKDLAGLSAYEPKRLGDQHQGTPLSTLSECAELIRRSADVTLYVEIKRQSLRSFGADTVLRAVLPQLATIRDQCYLISFDVAVLALARRAGWQRVAPVLTALEQLDGEDIQQLVPEMIFCDCDLLDHDVHSEDNPLRRIPYPVAIYEIDQYNDAQHWFSQGAALVETFAIGELIAAHRASNDE